jgi:hypothetical protein
MATKEAFIAGYVQGYREGRVGENLPEQVEENAKLHYQNWKKEKGKGKPQRSAVR